jgi:hypothetical protein
VKREVQQDMSFGLKEHERERGGLKLRAGICMTGQEQKGEDEEKRPRPFSTCL